MKPLLYSLIFFIFSLPASSQAQKTRGGHNNHSLRKNFKKTAPVIPQARNTRVKQKQDNGGVRTLEEAQDQLNKGGGSEKSSVSKKEPVKEFIKGLESVFSVADIQKQFPDFSTATIRTALRSLVSSGELILLRQGGRKWGFSVYVKAAVLDKEGWTSEEALRNYNESSSSSADSNHDESPNSYTSSKKKQMDLFIQNLSSAFTLSDIQYQFQDMSESSMHTNLKSLVSSGELIILQKGQSGSNYKPQVWIRAGVLHEKGISKGQALSDYYEVSKARRIRLFVQSLESPFLVSDIRRQFPEFSVKQIQEVLKELTSQRKLRLVSQVPGSPKWIRVDPLSEKRKTKMSKQSVESWLNSHTKAIIPFIEREEAFALSDIQKQFPNLSLIAIESVLDILTAETKLLLLPPVEQGDKLWISTAVLHNKGLTPEKALDRYYDKSEEGTSSMSNLLPSFREEKMETRVQPLNLKVNLSENRETAKVLFKLADSFEPNSLSVETKRAFREILDAHVDLSDTFFNLTQDIKEAHVLFLPKDALSIVWHIAQLKKMIPEGQPLDLSGVEDLTNRIIELIDLISLRGSRSNSGDSSNQVGKELDEWFSYWESGETAFGQ